MSCYQIEILPNVPEIIQLQKELAKAHLEVGQLQKELVNAHWEANLYKSHQERNVTIRERVQYEHDAAILKLQREHKEEVGNLSKKIKELEAKVKLRERQLFGKKGEQGSDFTCSFPFNWIFVVDCNCKP